MSVSPPSLAARLGPLDPRAAPSGIGLAIVNFNTAARTLRCLTSLRESTLAPDRIAILDNASSPEDFDALESGCTAMPHSGIALLRAGTNLGFAAGSNALIEMLLADPGIRFVALLNNDAIAKPQLLEHLLAAMGTSPDRVGLAGGRMNRLDAPEHPDTLGITLYASLMPANRLDVTDPYLGPTGGCCLLSRELLDDLKATSGYWFDERYFCYCEDTDLALRAVLLGYRPAYVDDVLALHEGQASSGADSAFIAYHGLRNLIWMHAKLVPGRLLVKYGVLLIAAHVMTFVRQALVGRFALMLKVYRDAFARLPEFREEGRRFARECVRIDAAELDRRIAPRFYRKGYLAEVIALIGRRWRGESDAAARRTA